MDNTTITSTDLNSGTVVFYDPNDTTPLIIGSYSGLYSSWSYGNTIINTDNYAINIEKLVSYEEKTRSYLEKMIENYNSNSFYYNTLISYGVLETKDSLERKVKISNLLK